MTRIASIATHVISVPRPQPVWTAHEEGKAWNEIKTPHRVARASSPRRYYIRHTPGPSPDARVPPISGAVPACDGGVLSATNILPRIASSDKQRRGQRDVDAPDEIASHPSRHRYHQHRAGFPALF